MLFRSLAREDDSLHRSADVASTFADLVQGLVYPFAAVVRLIDLQSDSVRDVLHLPQIVFRMEWEDDG